MSVLDLSISSETLHQIRLRYLSFYMQPEAPTILSLCNEAHLNNKQYRLIKRIANTEEWERTRLASYEEYRRKLSSGASELTEGLTVDLIAISQNVIASSIADLNRVRSVVRPLIDTLLSKGVGEDNGGMTVTQFLELMKILNTQEKNLVSTMLGLAEYLTPKSKPTGGRGTLQATVGVDEAVTNNESSELNFAFLVAAEATEVLGDKHYAVDEDQRSSLSVAEKQSAFAELAKKRSSVKAKAASGQNILEEDDDEDYED